MKQFVITSSMGKRLIAKGHQVTMMCSGRATQDDLLLPPGREFMEVDIDGIHVVTLPSLTARLAGPSGAALAPSQYNAATPHS